MNIKNLVAGVLALFLAFVFTFVLKDFSQIDMVLALITSLFGFWGVTSWRKQFDKSLAYFQSKTIWGAILTSVPMVILALAGFFGWQLPQVVVEIIKYLVAAGGGWTILGSSHAVAKHAAG